jgi:hypothetical protein
MRSWTIQFILLSTLVWLSGAVILSACSQGTLPPVESSKIAATPTRFATDSPTVTREPTDTDQNSSTPVPPEPADAILVVEFSPNDRIVRPIEFTVPITGVAALQAAGLEIVTADFGDSGLAVCSIGGVGCPADNCFCSTKFWSYESWTDQSWQPYQSAASGIQVIPGAIEGWRWADFGSGSLPPAPALAAAANTFDWIKTRQDPVTGGYDSPSSSIEVLLALGANGIDASSWRQKPGDPSLMDYWLANAATYSADGPANAGKLAVALAASGTCWPGDALLPSSYYTGTAGIYSPHTGFQAWAMLGTIALSQTLPMESIDYLTSLAQPDGGWEWNQGFGSDTNTTALAIQTLLAAGEPVDSPVILNAVQYLKSAQNADGGFPYAPASQFGSESDVNSTAYVVQAIQALGYVPITTTWTISETNPIQYLASMQLENGSFEWQKGIGENLVASAQAAASLLGRTYPFRIASLPACP